MTDAAALEAAIEKGRAGTATTGDILATFLSSPVLVATVDDYSPEKPMNPLILSAGDTTSMLVFTSFEHTKPFEASIKGAVSLQGKDVVLGIQSPAMGIIINPGSTLGFELDPAATASLADYVRSKSS